MSSFDRLSALWRSTQSFLNRKRGFPAIVVHICGRGGHPGATGSGQIRPASIELSTLSDDRPGDESLFWGNLQNSPVVLVATGGVAGLPHPVTRRGTDWFAAPSQAIRARSPQAIPASATRESNGSAASVVMAVAYSSGNGISSCDGGATTFSR